VVFPYNTEFGFLDGGDVSDISPGLSYGAASAAAVAEDASGMALMVDDARLVLLIPALSGFEVAQRLPIDSSFSVVGWPIDMGVSPRFGGAFAAYRKGRTINAFNTDGLSVNATDSVDSLFMPRVGGDMVVTAGDPLDTIHLWAPNGPEMAVHMGANVIGFLDATPIPHDDGSPGEYAVVVPLLEGFGGGGPVVRTVHVTCDGAVGCDSRLNDSFPGWGLGTRIAAGGLRGRPDGPGPLLLAAVSRPSEEPDGPGGDELSLYVMTPDGQTFAAEGRGQEPDGVFRLPLIQPSDLPGGFDDPVMRSLDSATVANERGDVDFMVATGITSRGRNMVRIYLTGARFCAP